MIGAAGFPRAPDWLSTLPFFNEVRGELERQREHRWDAIAMDWKWGGEEHHPKTVNASSGKVLLALDVWNAWPENQWFLETQPCPGHDRFTVTCVRESMRGCNIGVSSHWYVALRFRSVSDRLGLTTRLVV